MDAMTSAHRTLAGLPQEQRDAVLALLALPPTAQLCEIGGPCSDECGDPRLCDDDHAIVGILTAARLLDEVLSGIAAPSIVGDVLSYYYRGHRGPGPTSPDRVARPGLHVVR